jgi:hypothetical protein
LLASKSDDILPVSQKGHASIQGNQIMIELLATVVIMSSSVALFGYWFRYTCMLILSARTTRDYAAAVATANQLSFLEVQSMLREHSAGDLNPLKDSLDRDYKVLSYLLKHAANPSSGEDAVEKRMLEIHYRVMGAWYSVCRRVSPAAAYRALDEMASVVAHFANSMGAQTAASAA